MHKEEKTLEWKIACYIRLSREDGDCFESDSIINQRKLLSDFADKNFGAYNHEFYVDENVTGTKFDREQFNRMLKDIENNKINCIIVKDLSRFGRNYIDAGMLLEDFFPRHKVRFISVLDGLDTFTDADETTSLMVRIKNLMHDNNSREISRKVRASHDMMRRQGMHITHAIYGYKKDPANKYKLIPDDKVAYIVRQIFSWYHEGMGVTRIAQKLNNMNIASCSEYRLTGQLNSMDSTKMWRPTTIRKMLCNYSYVGCVHQGMQTTRSYKDRKVIYLDIDKHIIVENMHEPIIDRKLFDAVQRMINSRIKTRTANCRDHVYVFSGLLKCDNCGSGMLRCPTHVKGKDYVYYRCRKYEHGHKGCACPAVIKYEHLYEAVMRAVLRHITDCHDIQSRLQRLRSNVTNLSNLNEQLAEAKAYLIHQGELKCSAYEDWKLGVISKEDFLAIKLEIDTRMQKKQSEIDQMQSRINFLNGLNNLGWLDDITHYNPINGITREAALTLIHLVRIGRKQSVSVEFNHASEIDIIRRYLNAAEKSNG